MITVMNHGRLQVHQVRSDDDDRHARVMFLSGPDRAMTDGE